MSETGDKRPSWAVLVGAFTAIMATILGVGTVFVAAVRSYTSLELLLHKLDSDMGALETRIKSIEVRNATVGFDKGDLAALERDIGRLLAAERAYSRSLCYALTTVQEELTMPVTNDCDRP
ncbi:hypothetical protein [Poseidonocella sp. HB161398]|uniref:hypothetical protein n=1 Tax=Poseidonocella sp. HB161398 TaxID=2320855 RepID=UPI00110876E1|nr:hypothetical protein [Poseidonocella sp. HB161398]